VQGGTISLLVPTLAVLNLPEWKCPEPEILEEMSFENRTELWQSRMRVLSGAISVAAIIQVIIGLFGKMIAFSTVHKILLLSSPYTPVLL
jgi:nucleobase transporter 1/2